MNKYWDAFVSMITRPREYVEGDGKGFTLTDAVIYVAIIGAVVGFFTGLIGGKTFGGADVPFGGGGGAIGGLILGAIGAVVGLLIGAAILYVILAILKVNVDFSKLVSASGLAYTGNIASIIPFIGSIIAAVWQLYLLYLSLIGVAEVPSDKAKTTIIIIVIIYLIIFFLAFLLAGMAMVAALSGM